MAFEKLIPGTVDKLLETLTKAAEKGYAGSEIRKEINKRARNVLVSATNYVIYAAEIEDRVTLETAKTLLSIQTELGAARHGF